MRALSTGPYWPKTENEFYNFLVPAGVQDPSNGWANGNRNRLFSVFSFSAVQKQPKTAKKGPKSLFSQFFPTKNENPSPDPLRYINKHNFSVKSASTVFRWFRVFHEDKVWCRLTFSIFAEKKFFFRFRKSVSKDRSYGEKTHLLLTSLSCSQSHVSNRISMWTVVPYSVYYDESTNYVILMTDTDTLSKSTSRLFILLYCKK